MLGRDGLGEVQVVVMAQGGGVGLTRLDGVDDAGGGLVGTGDEGCRHAFLVDCSSGMVRSCALGRRREGGGVEGAGRREEG